MEGAWGGGGSLQASSLGDGGVYKERLHFDVQVFCFLSKILMNIVYFKADID